MVNPPTCHLQQIKTFNMIGLDCTGPIYLEERRAQNFKGSSAYVCLLICMSTNLQKWQLSNFHVFKNIIENIFRLWKEKVNQMIQL